MTQELFRQDSYLDCCEASVKAIREDGVILDQTVFYPTGGGQPGDRGWLRRASGADILIETTRKDRESGDIVHVCSVPPDLQTGESLKAEIDWEQRYRHMRMHTCLHLLCSVIDAPVTGGNIGDGKGRLDFILPEAPDKQDLTARLNHLIESDAAVRYRWISDAEMDAQPELVKTLSVQPPRGAGRVRLVDIDGIDLQPCGGTHLKATGEIGPVQVRKVESKGKSNRRITVAFAD